MDLTKRLGFSDDILKAATAVLEGKKISHPNQKEISTAAPPHDEITGADFKALKAKKKMHRVEGFDRNKKRYESPLFETYEEALAFLNKIRKSAPLTNLEIVELGETTQIDELSKNVVSSYMTTVAKKSPEEQKPSRETGMEVASKKLNKPKAVKVAATEEVVGEAKELNTANANDARAHDCAKHVVHEQWGVGETVPTMHAAPDTDGNIAWYDVMFEHGIEHQVPTSALEITLSETHVHKKSKRMSEAAEVGGKKIENLKTKKLPNGTLNPEQAKEEVEHVEEMDKSMAYATGTKRAMQMTGDNPPLEKSTIKKAHTIAKAMLRKEEAELNEKMSEFEKLAARRAWQKNPANKGKPLPTHLQTDQQKQKAAAKSTDMKMMTKEEVDTLDEGRKAGVVGSVLSSPAAREHFKKLTGKEPSYFHISKNPDHAQAALNHAAKAKAPEGEAPEAGEDDSDTEANKHPINQLRGIADRGKGRFMGKDITRAHANKLISMHDDLKPAQKLDFVSNIGKHLSKVMS